ncbi:MAG: nucleotide exchange factor GrpE [Lentisphaerales bacterium]|jgi:molecular chaperone GrpE|nr:MAG: nucleotide exchange factor GrpE [Lentisphaerales bacterium]
MKRRKKDPLGGDKEQAHQDPVSSQAQAEDGPSPGAAPEKVEQDDRYLRLRADFDNFRKRVLRERQETSRRAQDELLEELLPVLDHIELGLRAAADHDPDGTFLAGYRMLSDQFTCVLTKFGLEPVPATGMQDPNLHEAVSHVPSDEPGGTIIHEIRRGYKSGKRLLRAAQVVVASSNEDDQDVADDDRTDAPDATAEEDSEPQEQRGEPGKE